MYIRRKKLYLLVGVFSIIVFYSFIGNGKGLPYPIPELKLFPPLPYTDNIPTVKGVELGRFLFYDTILSIDSSFSCGSCHIQKFAFSDSPNQFSSGINGKKMDRNTPPLFNLPWYSSLFWDGKAKSIEEQVFHPVAAHDEMNLDWKTATKRIQSSRFYRKKFSEVFGQQTIDSILIAKAIGQFERILISNNSKYDKVINGDDYFTKDEYTGFVIINEQNRGDCLHCHTTDADALGTNTLFSNNGLDNFSSPKDYIDKGKATITKNDNDLGWFKIPSLRNIEVTGPYMHDGRFQTLEEVIDFYSEGVKMSYNIDSKMGYAHQGGVQLNDLEKKQVIAFLKTLTDTAFLTNPEFSNPYK